MTKPTKFDEYKEIYKQLRLPASRIRTIMKSSPDLEKMSSPEALYLMTKITEMFIAKLAQLAYEGSTKIPITLEYKHICEIVHNNSDYHFLKEIVPKKITYRRFKEIMEKEQLIANESDTSEDVTDNNSNDEEEEIKIVPQARNKTYGAKKK
uniref:Transcription factor CBF/NF-Y/archaeal histone domain-containing protein n=1 Tax=Timema tahoe TaxID=61484 RepID=A0A7R9IEQ8_9NEOP|nr:unnamed protein product [Timema tahoe]